MKKRNDQCIKLGSIDVCYHSWVGSFISILARVQDLLTAASSSSSYFPLKSQVVSHKTLQYGNKSSVMVWWNSDVHANNVNMLNHNFACKPMQMPFDIKKVTKLNLEGFATETAKSWNVHYPEFAMGSTKKEGKTSWKQTNHFFMKTTFTSKMGSVWVYENVSHISKWKCHLICLHYFKRGEKLRKWRESTLATFPHSPKVLMSLISKTHLDKTQEMCQTQILVTGTMHSKKEFNSKS